MTRKIRKNANAYGRLFMSMAVIKDRDRLGRRLLDAVGKVHAVYGYVGYLWQGKSFRKQVDVSERPLVLDGTFRYVLMSKVQLRPLSQLCPLVPAFFSGISPFLPRRWGRRRGRVGGWTRAVSLRCRPTTGLCGCTASPEAAVSLHLRV